tara:strand:+ start:608 stop:898 length:291 start_codon:yes stop_codon:yes gene_type:complete
MAIGDIINDQEAPSGGLTWYTFQPAAGVDIVITSVSGQGTDCRGGLSDGVNQSDAKLYDQAEFASGQNTKFGINNTNYLIFYDNAGGPSFSGIQIK